MNLNCSEFYQVGDGSPQDFEAKPQIRAEDANYSELMLSQLLSHFTDLIEVYQAEK